MAMNLLHRPYRKLAMAAGLFSAGVVVIHILLPLLVNCAGIRARILSQVSAQFSGKVDFQAIRPALLPIPHAEVIQARISQPGTFSIRLSKAIVYPQFWPLFAGRLKINRLRFLKPEIVIVLPAEASPNAEKPEKRTLRILGLQIRDSLAGAARGMGLPAARIENGRLTFLRGDQPDVEFTHLLLETEASGEQLALRVTGRSDWVQTFGFKGRIDLNTLNGSGQMDLSGLEPAHFFSFGIIPAPALWPEMVMDMAINLQTQGLETFQGRFQAKAPQIVVKNGPRRLTVREPFLEGMVRWTARQVQIDGVRFQSASPGMTMSGNASWPLMGQHSVVPEALILKGVDLDVTEIREAFLQLAGDEQAVRNIFDIVQGGWIPELSVAINGSGEALEEIGKRIRLQGRLTGGRIVVGDDLLRLEAVSGEVALDKGRLSARHLSARLGSSRARNGSLELGLMDGTHAFALDTEVDADLADLPDTLRRSVNGKETPGLLDQIQPITGRVKGRLRLGDSLDRMTARITANGRIKVLDAALDLSGTIDGLPSAGTAIQLALSGAMGPRTVEWLARRGAVPDEFLPKAPVTVTRSQLTRNSAGGIDFSGEFSLEDGLQVTAALTIDQSELDVSSLHLKDTASDAVIVFRQGRDGRKWTAGFNGYLGKSTVDRLLRQNNLVQGWLRGDLKADFQTDAPGRTAIKGRLVSRQITIPMGARPPLSILDASLEGQGDRFDISSAVLKWQESTARLSGIGRFSPQALGLDLTFSADTLDADKIIQAFKAEEQVPGSQPLKANDTFPVRGKVRVAAGQMVLGGYRFAPLQAVVTLQAEKTTVDVLSADLCGIATPGQIRFDRAGLQMAFKPHAVQSALRDTDQCLAGARTTERLEGTVNANGTIRTQGRSGDELVRNLAGDMDLQISDGRIYNVGAAGFFTNLLAFISVNQLIQGELPDLRKNDFKYNSLTAKLALKDGRLRIEEGVLKSNAVNIVGHGDYGLASKKMDLVLLVSPLTTVDWIVERIPLIGSILQGTLVAIPVGVKGPAVDPAVVPLSPAAVGSRLGGILERTVKTPFRILSPLWKDKSPSK